jgi:anti-sigma factor RsiW
MSCKWVRFAYRALPLPAWRAILLDRHIGRCPRCQSEALDDDAIRLLGVTPAGLGSEPPLRPFAAESKPSPPAKGIRARRYAFATLLLAALLGVAVAVLRLAPPARGVVSVSEDGADRRVFAVLAAQVGGEPARPVVFKPGRPGMTIVWFEKSMN